MLTWKEQIKHLTYLRLAFHIRGKRPALRIENSRDLLLHQVQKKKKKKGDPSHVIPCQESSGKLRRNIASGKIQHRCTLHLLLFDLYIRLVQDKGKWAHSILCHPIYYLLYPAKHLSTRIIWWFVLSECSNRLGVPDEGLGYRWAPGWWKPFVALFSWQRVSE